MALTGPTTLLTALARPSFRAQKSRSIPQTDLRSCRRKPLFPFGATWVRSAGADAAFASYNPFGATSPISITFASCPTNQPNHVLATYHYAFLNAYIYTNYMVSGNTDVARAPLANPIGAAMWDRAYCTTPAAMQEGGGPFGSASSYDASTGKWVVNAGTYGSGMWKYVEPM
jgi:hypothetical protein